MKQNDFLPVHEDSYGAYRVLRSTAEVRLSLKLKPRLNLAH